MRRRDLIIGLGAVALVGSAQAQQSGKVHRIAVVSASGPAAHVLASDSPMWDELRRLGYVEGQNLLIERYSGEGRAKHYSELIREVVRRNPDVIIAFNNAIVLDFKAATTTIPIVGMFGGAVEAGIVQSLARPGGNITGVSVDIGNEQWGKRIQLLRQVVPQASRFASLVSRSIRDHVEARILEYCRMAGITLVGPPLDYPINEAEYRRVFAAFVQDSAEGVVVTDGYENWEYRGLIVELAEKHRLPAIYPFRDCVDAGGLMSYGMSTDASRRAAGMVVEILKGAKPADIPVYQPTKFELVINLKAAKALGLTMPTELRAIADGEIDSGIQCGSYPLPPCY
jgi:putative ABC transport system substrate-binding protein